jgi:hypothetical protein
VFSTEETKERLTSFLSIICLLGAPNNYAYVVTAGRLGPQSFTVGYAALMSTKEGEGQRQRRRQRPPQPISSLSLSLSLSHISTKHTHTHTL